MVVRLAENNYGKSRVRVLKVDRTAYRHEIREMTLAIHLEGDFEAVHTQGDNSKVLPTDTMKNTVYALARKNPVRSAEAFSLQLIDHFLSTNRHVTRVRIETVEDLWAHISREGVQYPTAFFRPGEARRTASLNGTREGITIKGGIENLVVLKTTKSAFEGFMKDAFTTLREDRDRILATSIRAEWAFEKGEVDFNSIWEGVRQVLLETFADHESLSLQHTLYCVGEAVLRKFPPIGEIHLSLPNKHYNLVDLSKLGLDNPGDVFLPTDEPHGLIEANLRRE